MNSTPTTSRNDVAAAGSNSFQHQQQQGPLQQRPSLSSPPTHGASPARQYSSHNVSESSNTNSNQHLDYQTSSGNRGNSYSGGISSTSNGYNNMTFSSTPNHNRDSTLERQRSAMTQQQATTTNQMTISPYHLSGGVPSYGIQPSFNGGGTSDNTQSNTSSTMSTESPSQSQNLHHNSNTMGQPMASPQQALQISSHQHQHHQMNLQQQFQQQNQQHYQLYQHLQQQDSTSQAQIEHATSTHKSLDGNSISNHNNMNSELQFHNQRMSSPAKQTSSPMQRNEKNISSTGSATVDEVQLSNVSPLTASNVKNGATTIAAPSSSSNSVSMVKINSSSTTAPPQAVSSNKINGSNAGASTTASTIPQLPPEKMIGLLSRCKWVDKTVWASRQLLGGQAVNGFLRATATVQRIKKQRARQNVKSGKSKVNASSNTASATSSDVGGDNTNAASSSTSNAAPTLSLEEQQAEEEVLKTEIMNARTAKKIKQELEGGIQFCVLLHDTIRSIIQQMDPSIPPLEPLNSSSFARRAANQFKPSTIMTAVPPVLMLNGNTATKPGSKLHQGPGGTASAKNTVTSSSKAIPQFQFGMNQNQSTSGSSPSHIPQNNATGSTLRRHRRTKHSPSGEVLIQLPDVDEVTGKRQNTKKGQPHRLTDVVRFRALRQGDPVAARVTSRDLWILARVMKDYPGTNLTPVEFLRLSDSRREQLFKEMVLIQDVEEHDGGAAAAVWISRSLVLPLPRNVSEAAEWGNFYRFYKKGSRVYAMYPQTTSLYTATVVDCSTYCRREEDILVVEFDGDEPDPATGKLPACHIPARFVTLIPKEFPGAQSLTGAAASGGSSNSASNSSNKRKRAPVVNNAIDDVDIMNGVLDDLNFDGDLPGLDQFDDLDFDLLGDG